jgi:hypothetical protein
MPVISLRVDDETARVLRDLARARKKTRSAVIRDSLFEYAGRHEAGSSDSLYERMKAHIGVVKDGPSDLSVDTGRRVREILRRKRDSSR